jgi:hypothetical protein
VLMSLDKTTALKPAQIYLWFLPGLSQLIQSSEAQIGGLQRPS